MKLSKNVLWIVSVVVGIFGVGGQTARAATPPVTSGLVAQWDAKNIDGLNNTTLTDGGSVVSWLNVAPGAADSATVGALTAPTFIANGFENRPVVRFSNDELTDFAPSLNITGFGLSIFVLMQQSAVAPDGYLGNYGGANTGYYLNENTTANGFSFFAGASVNSAGTTAFSTLNKPLIVGGVQDSSNVKLYINGALLNTQPSAAITSSGAPFGIGNDGRNYPGPGDGYWNGDYRHLLVYNRALSDSERESVFLFLNGEIPEPSTIALFASGGFWLFLRRRHRRSSAC